jgi:hypothetical protein
MKGFYWILILLLLSVGQIESVQAAPASPSGAAPVFPKPVEEYHDEQIAGITAKLVQRIQVEPFNLVGTLIFLGAIIHTFLASKFMLIAHRLEHQYLALKEQEKDASDDKELSRMRDRLQFRAQLFHFLGEVEAVFGIWLIPLAIAILVMKGWGTPTSLRCGDRCCRTNIRGRRYGDGEFPTGFAFRRGLPCQGGKSRGVNRSGLVAGDSHGGTPAGIFYHGAGGHDDLCPPSSAEIL